MAENNRRKVQKSALIESLIEDIKKIDSDDSLKQTVRTKMYERAAKKLRNRMYEDGRRSDKTVLTLQSYRRYLSDVRKALRAENWQHHSLSKNLVKLAKKYPALESEIIVLESLDSESRRKKHTELLAKTKELLKSTKESIYRDAYSEFKALNLDHYVLRFLAMQAIEADQIAEMDKDSLEAKKTNVITINYHWIIRTINELLGSSMFSYRAVGLALASGRRSVEVLYQGEFEATGEHTVSFSGHAKKRGGADYEKASSIYTLIPAEQFCEELKLFRSMEPVKALEKYDDLPETQRNVEINRRTAKTLNTATKKAFDNDDRMFKETRAIWARIVYEQHFKQDKQWAKVDEDIFWREMLGHKEDDTQEHYKYVKLDDTELPKHEEPVFVNAKGENIRVSRLKKLAKLPEISKRKALVKINDFVISRINEDAETEITQTLISKGLGANRAAIKDYLKLVDEHHKDMMSKPETATKKKPARAGSKK